MSFFKGLTSPFKARAQAAVPQPQPPIPQPPSTEPIRDLVLQERILLEKFQELLTAQGPQLLTLLRQIAIEDGVTIPNWDQEWGKYHLQDNAGGKSPWILRLLRAFLSLENPAPILLKKFETYPKDQQPQLFKTLKRIAIEDGVTIPNWDREWGKYHLQDNADGKSPWMFRLLRAFLILDDTRNRQQTLDKVATLISKKWSPDIVTLLFTCDSIARLRIGVEHKASDEMIVDLSRRAEMLTNLKAIKQALRLENRDHLISKLWKSLELKALLSENPVSPDTLLQLNSLSEVTAENGAIFLKVILNRTAHYPRQELLQGAIDLRDIRARALNSALAGQINPSSYSCFKDIFTISSSDGTILGKYKTNSLNRAAKEAYGYTVDSLLGADMAAATITARISLKQALESLGDHYARAAGLRERAKKHQADELHEQTMQQSGTIAPAVLNELYRWLTEYSNKPIEKGHDLWWNLNGCNVDDAFRKLAIDDYLQSEAYTHFCRGSVFESKDKQGSLQKWIQGPSQRVYDFMLTEPTAGKQLKQLSKATVHLYCLLNLIKGSQDVSSGNTMMIFTNGQINQLCDFDDEHAMTDANNFKEVRMWQLGLPQANLPFDKTAMLLFSEPDIFNKIDRQNRTDKTNHISRHSYDAQNERAIKIRKIFQARIASRQSITPRELFFEIFGGRDSYNHFHYLQKINPWLIFEHYLGNIGHRDDYFEKSKSDHTILNANFTDLYS